jgi:pyruvate dehydrogenase E2 component (dihydrolipoamide acetyltransferase)
VPPAPKKAADTAAAKPSAPTYTQASPGANPYFDTPLTNMRKVIAQRLVESKTTIPHFYLTLDVNVDQLLTLRK